METIDIYDADLRPKGTMERRAAHIAGEWHRTFHCWVYCLGDAPGLLLQERSPSATNFPSALDVSAAGHLSAGESPDEGVRELTEELGITASASDLTFIGDRVEVADQNNGQHNREYQAVFMLEVPKETHFAPEPKEVYALWWFPVHDNLTLLAGSDKTRSVNVEGIRLADDNTSYEPAVRSVRFGDLLPRIQRYYLAAAIAVERLAEGKSAAIS